MTDEINGGRRRFLGMAAMTMTVARLEAAASRKARSDVALHFRRSAEHRQ